MKNNDRLNLSEKQLVFHLDSIDRRVGVVSGQESLALSCNASLPRKRARRMNNNQIADVDFSQLSLATPSSTASVGAIVTPKKKGA